MKAFAEKDHAGRTIWRVKYHVAQRPVRKTFQTLEAANWWIAINKEIATDEGRIFWESWNAIDPRERHEVMDALRLMREFRSRHAEGKLTLVEAARKQIALVEAIEKSLPFSTAVDRFLASKLNRKRKGNVSAGWLKVLDTCLHRVARELPDKTLVEFSTEEIEEAQEAANKAYLATPEGLYAIELTKEAHRKNPTVCGSITIDSEKVTWASSEAKSQAAAEFAARKARREAQLADIAVTPEAIRADANGHKVFHPSHCGIIDTIEEPMEASPAFQEVSPVTVPSHSFSQTFFPMIS